MKRKIRRARREDLERLHEIERDCFPGIEQLTESQLAALAFRIDVAALAVESGGKVIGFALVHFHETAARLLTIDVSLGSRGKGFGRALLAEAEAEAIEAGCQTMSLEVRVVNAEAINLYEMAGYARMRRVRDYYPEGSGGSDDAYEMEKVLSRPQ